MSNLGSKVFLSGLIKRIFQINGECAEDLFQAASFFASKYELDAKEALSAFNKAKKSSVVYTELRVRMVSNRTRVEVFQSIAELLNVDGSLVANNAEGAMMDVDCRKVIVDLLAILIEKADKVRDELQSDVDTAKTPNPQLATDFIVASTVTATLRDFSSVFDANKAKFTFIENAGQKYVQ